MAYKFVSTFVFLYLFGVIYWLEAFLRPMSSRLEVIMVAFFFVSVSAVPAFTITTLMSRWFKLLGVNTAAFLAVSVPLGVAAMACIGSMLSQLMTVTSTHACAHSPRLGFPSSTWIDETGLHYNYYRDYDAVTGRYLQSDPGYLLAE